MKITLRYGITKLENVEVNAGTTVGELEDDFGAALGLPESADATVNGTVVDEDYEVSNADTVSWEKRACNKA